jgi:hypothetical protein
MVDKKKTKEEMMIRLFKLLKPYAARIAVYGISALSFTSATVAKHNNFAKVESENTSLKQQMTVNPKIKRDTVISLVVDTVETVKEVKVPYLVKVDTCIPKTIHPYSKGPAYYDSARKSPRQPIGIREIEFSLADTAVDIHRAHPNTKPIGEK